MATTDGCEVEISPKEEKSKLIAALSFFLVVLIIGIPVWWKTTEVYRVALPYEDIRALNESTLNIPITVTIAACENSLSDADYALEASRLHEEDLLVPPVIENAEKFGITVHWEVRRCSTNELSLVNGASSISDLDAKLQLFSKNLSSIGSITIYVLPKRFQLFEDSVVHMGAHRAMFLKFEEELHDAVLQASTLVRSTILSPIGLQEAYLRFGGAKTERPDKTSMRTLPSTAAIDVTFTLILPDPALANTWWDIEAATCDYLNPLADKLKDIVTLSFKSQVLYLTTLDIRAHYNSERKHYVLTYDQLPHIVNPVESKLGSYISTNPGLNFVVYVPPLHQAPLQIYDLDGEPSPLNAFLLPRWGGFMLYNAERLDGKDATLPINMQHVMGIILPQLRSLLGIPHQTSTMISHSDMDSSHIRDWEMDSILRMRIIENLLTSTSTLQSLAQLLEEISNIVIADHVGEKVYQAVQDVADAYSALNDGDIIKAFSSSKKALIASEAAFFDPSMLALLYFPDDQKYAIYVPLFLPVSLPLVLSLISAVKYYKSHKQTALKTEKVD